VVLALPEIYSEFDVSIVGVSWTITAYNIAIVIGALADITAILAGTKGTRICTDTAEVSFH